MDVTPYDDVAIKDNHTVIRRVNPKQHLVFDENRGTNRTTSKLFSPSSGRNGGMSVDIKELIEADGLNAQDYVTNPIYTGAIAFNASSARALQLRIGCEPLETNPYHAEVWGSKSNPNKFSRAQKKALAAASTWFVKIPDVEI